MEKKSAMVRQFVGKEFESGNHALARIRTGQKSAALSNANRGEAKAGGCDTGDSGIVGRCLAGVTAILDQTGLRVRLFPKIATGRSLDIVEQLIVFGGKRLRGLRCGSGGIRWPSSRKRRNRGREWHCHSGPGQRPE